ncbi:MAG: hypothetical protein HUK02_10580, partial [Bacteroidaceae bacterium]|nr:hypothetical protein [Bacteroidaceae bacterium]
RWGIDKICAYASEQSGVEVRIERFRLSPLLDLDLQGVVATNPDTLLAVRHCLVDLDFGHILRGNIGVEAIDLEEGAFHSRDFIATTQLQGRVGQFHLAAGNLDLKEKIVHLSSVALHNSTVDIAMLDTTVVDTADSNPLPWRVLIDDILLTRSSVVFHQPGDSLRVGGEIDTLRLTDGDVNLAEGRYSVVRAEMLCPCLQYDQPYKPLTDGLDYNHLKASDVNLIVESLLYVEEGTRVSARILQGQAREQSGLELCGLSGSLQLDEQQMTVSYLSLATPHSHLSGDVQLSWTALTENAGGYMTASLKAAVAKTDVALFVPAYADYLPKNGLTADLSLSGNVDTLHVDAQHLLIEPMLAARAKGTLYHLLDPARLSADLKWEAESFDLSELHKMLNLPSSVRLP